MITVYEISDFYAHSHDIVYEHVLWYLNDNYELFDDVDNELKTLLTDKKLLNDAKVLSLPQLKIEFMNLMNINYDLWFRIYTVSPEIQEMFDKELQHIQTHVDVYVIFLQSFTLETIHTIRNVRDNLFLDCDSHLLFVFGEQYDFNAVNNLIKSNLDIMFSCVSLEDLLQYNSDVPYSDFLLSGLFSD